MLSTEPSLAVASRRLLNWQAIKNLLRLHSLHMHRGASLYHQHWIISRDGGDEYLIRPNWRDQSQDPQTYLIESIATVAKRVASRPRI